MIVGGAIALWVVAVALTCAMCIATARADRASITTEDGHEPDPSSGSAPANPTLAG